jgi:hypothetical protein
MLAGRAERTRIRLPPAAATQDGWIRTARALPVTPVPAPRAAGRAGDGDHASGGAAANAGRPVRSVTVA